jgi:hypothetical protein
MNQHDDGAGPDHGWSDPAEAGLLKQTFSAMADGVDPASPTGPAATMTVMSRRVRRRRTAKLGGLGGGALALAGALVLGAGQLAPSAPDQSELLPGSPSSSSTPTSSPVQADTPEFKVKDGYQPPWLDWSDLTCGMPVADLETTASGWSVAPAGDIYARTTHLGDAPSTSWRMAASVETGQGVLDSSLALVWSQDGSVVDLGPDVFGAAGQPDPVPLISSDPVAYLEAHGSGASSCAPSETGGDPVYEARLPEGDYDVRVVAFPHDGSGQDGSGTLGAVVVSDPVAVHIDAAGAHSRTGTRGGESTIEPPEPVPGEISRFELDRSTDWVTASMTYRRHLPAPAVSLTARCESTDPEDTVPLEVVQQSTGQAVRSGLVTCDGNETVLPFGAFGISEGALDIQVPFGQVVPDGVAGFWAVLAPSAGAGTAPGAAAGDCSADGFESPDDAPSLPDGAAGETAEAILEAARSCDSGQLIELATASGAELMLPMEAPEATFALPETAALPYRTLAALLGGTTGGVRAEQSVEGGQVSETVVWPRVALDEFAGSDEAWQEVVDAGLLTADEAAAQRANVQFGYQGMTVSIHEDGRWRAFSAVGSFARE